jgi:predicted MFS family arabinose efflux permease
MSMPTLMTPSRPLGLAPFRRLATTYTLNELAWAFGTVALAVLVYDRSGSALATTALFVSTTFVPALVAPALAARLDRLALRRALPVLYLAESGLFAALALLSDRFWLPAVLALALADGAIAITARALTRAAVAATLKPLGALEAGNRLLNVLFSIAFATGPALAGLVVARAGLAASLAAAAALFLLMGLILATARALPGAAGGDSGWRARLGDGLRHVRARRPVRRVLGAHAAMVVAGAAVLPVEVVFVRQSLGSGTGAYGLLLAAWGAGTVLSSVALTRVRGRPALTLVRLGAAATGAGYLVMAGAPSLAVALAGAFVGGAGNGVSYVSVVQALQDRVDQAFQARVMALLESVNAGGYGLGFVLGGAVASISGPRAAIALAGVALLAAAAAVVALVRADAPPAPARSGALDPEPELAV